MSIVLFVQLDTGLYLQLSIHIWSTLSSLRNMAKAIGTFINTFTKKWIECIWWSQTFWRYLSNSEKGPKNSGLNGDSDSDVSDAGAVLHQLSYQANLQLVVMLFDNSWFSLTWWDGHVGVQNNGKMSLTFCIIIESNSQKTFSAIVLYTNMAAVTSHENRELEGTSFPCCILFSAFATYWLVDSIFWTPVVNLTILPIWKTWLSNYSWCFAC